MKEYSFEKLEVWQLARELVKKIYIITKEYPSEEKYGLCSQTQRASVSVMSNIACPVK
jgi:four helix bundle protein